jgi:cupin 2 domain-containing protein
MENIFKNIPDNLPEELIGKISGDAEKGITIERIVSRGQASPPGFWYDQDKSEFVILLTGNAGLLFKNPDEIIEMTPGDYIDIPAHRPHRVEWTSDTEETVWLAVHY